MAWRTGATVARVTMLAGLTVVATARAEPPRARATAGEAAIDPRADHALKGMCAYLQGLHSLRVGTTTVDEKVTTDGQKIQELKESKVTVLRPSAIAVDRSGPHGRVLFRYDGKRFAVFSVDKNIYASAPAPATLEAAIDEAGARYGIDAPGGDLVAGDAYAALLDGVTEARYIGLEPIGGAMAHHLAMRKDKIDYQLWIKDGPEPTPMRYVITSRDLPGAPQFTLDLYDFEPNPPLSPASFAFVPPPGAQQVALNRSGSRP